MMNGRPLTTRKKIQFLVILTILAWATQTLSRQWARGEEIGSNLPSSEPRAIAQPAPTPTPAAAIPGAVAPVAAMPEEKFVPSPIRASIGRTLELKAEATILGPEVRLKQICRWSDADAALFTPLADLIVLRLDAKTPFKSISLDELKTTLADAKANLAMIKFSGPMLCTVHRSDVQLDGKESLQQWIDAREGGAKAAADPEPARAATPVVRPGVTAEPAAAVLPAAASQPVGATVPIAAPVAAEPAPAAAVVADASGIRSLRQRLTEDLSIRLNLPVDQLQIHFNPKDERVLNLAEPAFQFNLEAVRVRNLGEVLWDVLLVHGNNTQKVSIGAVARAWQTQTVSVKPLAARQVIRPGDVEERRTLIDHMNDEPLLSLAQTVGQQASRDLKPGTIFTGRMVDAVPLARPGQLITISLSQGGIRVKTVGRALEGGSFGQSIKVKNDASGDTYDVILTAPQEGTLGTVAGAGAEARVVAARE